MDKIKVVIAPHPEVRMESAVVNLVGKGAPVFVRELENNRIETEAPSIVKAFLTRGDVKEWDIRPYFDGQAWSQNELEIHLTPEDGVRLAKQAVDDWLNSRIDFRTSLAFRRQWSELQKRLSAQFPWSVEFTDWPGGKFPSYSAPLRKIPKKRKGEFRIIAVPSPEQKHAARRLLPTLEKWLDRKLPIHGFVRGRNAVTNAKPHIGYAWSLCFDLEDFFDHVTLDKLVAAGLPLSIADIITDRDGIARQGYPTSPCAANIAFQDVDRALLKEIKELKQHVVYTRYADDLSFSSDSPQTLSRVKLVVEKLVPQFGFKISARKVHWWNGIAGRRVITGVSVGNMDVRAPREIRRRLRAATHQCRISQVIGLAEWNKLKEPASETLIT